MQLNMELHGVLGVLLISGYCRVPYRELYWADSPDVHTESRLQINFKK